ncbi:hypothetical protein C8255_10975 [filamentous cyanobacterium CCP3]|nr:hypothetical protein C8255_10975 [filamentous cyanobacterium CCP3]
MHEQGQLAIDLPPDVVHRDRVRVIVLIPEEGEPGNTLEHDPDDDSVELVVESIREGWQQALTGQTRPVSELWDSSDVK